MRKRILANTPRQRVAKGAHEQGLLKDEAADDGSTQIRFSTVSTSQLSSLNPQLFPQPPSAEALA